MANFYLELARKVLAISRAPLTARQIIDYAKTADLIPEQYWSAKTPHKTVQARLSESIRQDGSKSPFYRFAPGTFGLRSNLLELEYRQHFTKEYKAPIRRKAISSEHVLCIKRSQFELDLQNGFFSRDAFNRFIADSNQLFYMPRKLAEKDFSLKQIVTYVAVISRGRVLCYERGTYSAAQDELIGRKSIGFGGHVSQADLDLFSTDRFGIITNAQRELREELSLGESPDNNVTPSVIGLINDNTTTEGQKHLAIAMIAHDISDQDPAKGELEIRNLHWKSLRHTPNDLTEFEIWSQIFFRYLLHPSDNALYAHR